MADDALPMLEAVLSADITEYTAGLDEAKEQMSQLAESVDASSGAVDESLTGTGEAFGRLGESADLSATESEESAGRISAAFGALRDDLDGVGVFAEQVWPVALCLDEMPSIVSQLERLGPDRAWRSVAPYLRTREGQLELNTGLGLARTDPHSAALVVSGIVFDQIG